MQRKLTLLISSAGRRVGLIECFRSDASRLGIELEVVAVDANPAMSVACQIADAAFRVPPCMHADFIGRLLEICRDNSVDLLVPTIDTELEILSLQKARFQEIGTVVVLSSPEVVRLAGNKLQTARFLEAAGIPIPRTAARCDDAIVAGGWNWPLVMKPTTGSASRNVMAIDSPEALSRSRVVEDCIVQEYLHGDEYTVNVFFDQSGRLRCAIPHLRYEVRAGEVSKGITRRHARLEAIAETLGAVLPGARGPLCFQAIVTEGGQIGVLEINARFGGGYPLAHAAGARFSQWLLEEAAGIPSDANNDWREGVTMLRYDAALFRETVARGPS